MGYKSGGITLLDFRQYYKVTVIKTVLYLYQNRYTDQWNGIENPEINPDTYGQLISNKAGKNIKMGKLQSLQQVVMAKMDSFM